MFQKAAWGRARYGVSSPGRQHQPPPSTKGGWLFPLFWLLCFCL